MRSRLLLLVALLVGAQACSQVYTRRGLIETKADATPHWDHEFSGLDWPGTCAEGRSQSPINLHPSSTKLGGNLKAVLKFGKAVGARLLNTGHALQVEWDSETDLAATVPVVGDSVYNMFNLPSLNEASDVTHYELKPLQFHWHSMSEHQHDGQEGEIELHIVNQLVAPAGGQLPKECQAEGTKCLAVFGILFGQKKGAEVAQGDPFFDMVLKNLPEGVGPDFAKPLPVDALDLNSLLPAKKEYQTYTGSLTTPPCSEGVIWHVFKQMRRTLSAVQVARLQAALAKSEIELPCENGEGECKHKNGNRMNNRIVCALNGRKVFTS